MPKEYTIEELEAAHLSTDDGRVPHVPFGFLNDAWNQFKSQILPGDKIFDFTTSPESWKKLAGRQGYVLVRDGVVIATFVTLMN